MKDYILSKAVVLKKQLEDGSRLYRISSRILNYEGDIPKGGFLSNWCKTEEKAAEKRRSHQINSK